MICLDSNDRHDAEVSLGTNLDLVQHLSEVPSGSRVLVNFTGQLLDFQVFNHFFRRRLEVSSFIRVQPEHRSPLFCLVTFDFSTDFVSFRDVSFLPSYFFLRALFCF